MKRLIIAVMLAGLGFGAAQAANNYVKVEYGGEKHTYRKLDFETMSVCAFKRQLADQFDLKIRSFDLKRGGRVLNEDKTLKAVHIANGNTLSIVEKNHSFQCS